MKTLKVVILLGSTNPMLIEDQNLKSKLDFANKTPKDELLMCSKRMGHPTNTLDLQTLNSLAEK